MSAQTEIPIFEVALAQIEAAVAICEQYRLDRFTTFIPSPFIGPEEMDILRQRLEDRLTRPVGSVMIVNFRTRWVPPGLARNARIEIDIEL